MESSDYFYNQVKFLLYSFRKYAGVLKDSFFYICVNDAALDSSRVGFLESNFGPIKIDQKKYHGKMGSFARRYNLFQHFNMLDDFDVFVSIDCDIMIGSDFSDVFRPDISVFRSSGKGTCVVRNYEKMLIDQFNFTSRDIDRFKTYWKSVGLLSGNTLPHFNGGFWSVNSQGFKAIRAHIFNYLEKCHKLVRNGTIKTPSWNFEQTALSILIMKELGKFHCSNISYKGPEIYHNFKGLYGDLHYRHPDTFLKNKQHSRDVSNIGFIHKIISEYQKLYTL